MNNRRKIEVVERYQCGRGERKGDEDASIRGSVGTLCRQVRYQEKQGSLTGERIIIIRWKCPDTERRGETRWSEHERTNVRSGGSKVTGSQGQERGRGTDRTDRADRSRISHVQLYVVVEWD